MSMSRGIFNYRLLQMIIGYKIKELGAILNKNWLIFALLT